MKYLAAPVLAFSVFGGALAAQSADRAQIDALFDALAMPEVLEIMRTEGLEYGDTLSVDLFPGGANPQWDSIVSDIYSIDFMTEELRAAFDEELEGDDVGAMVAFFTADPGRSIVQLEVSARAAMLDDAVEQASKDNAAIAAADLTDRYKLVEQFIEINDLIETNVAGALNANYAFYQGLFEGGVRPPGVTSESALQEVWAQEEEIRSNTTEWMYSYLLLAYQPLPDEDLRTYIEFMQSEAGQDLNNAIFVAFNGMFNDISRSLGRASSRFMLSQEL